MIATSNLTETSTQEYRKTQPRQHVGVGFDGPKLRRMTTAPSGCGFFIRKSWHSSNGWAVWGIARCAGPKPGLSTRTVPPSHLTVGTVEETHRKLRSPAMANPATPAPKIRPKSLEQRVRRHLERLEDSHGA